MTVCGIGECGERGDRGGGGWSDLDDDDEEEDEEEREKEGLAAVGLSERCIFTVSLGRAARLINPLSLTTSLPLHPLSLTSIPLLLRL